MDDVPLSEISMLVIENDTLLAKRLCAYLNFRVVRFFSLMGLLLRDCGEGVLLAESPLTL